MYTLLSQPSVFGMDHVCNHCSCKSACYFQSCWLLKAVHSSFFFYDVEKPICRQQNTHNHNMFKNSSFVTRMFFFFCLFCPSVTCAVEKIVTCQETNLDAPMISP